MTDLTRRLLERVRDFVFRPATAKYAAADSGAVVSDSRVRDVLTKRIEAGQSTADALLNALTGGDIRVSEWRDNFAVELRRMNIEAFGLGRGGFDQIMVADRAIIEARLKDQYAFLREFASEVAQGNVSDAEILRRMNMYVNDVRSSYWDGQAQAQKVAGMTQEMRVLGATHKHCEDCIGYAGHWEDIGALPEPGDDCQCTSNCVCSKVYR